MAFLLLFASAMSQSPGVPETLATAYNPGMCLLALPVIATALDVQCTSA